MGFNVTVTPVVQEVDISASVQAYEVEIIVNSDIKKYADDAKASADQAEASAISADNSADSALASATSATASANSASSSASSASSSASTATTQAGIATTKANEASQSASNALASEQASAISEANALQSEQNALASEQSALASANTATSQAGIATTKAGEASASASSALASQNSATASASTATTQAGIATTQASNALASANAAAASAASAAQVGTSTLLTGFSVGANTAIAGTDTILQAFNKTQGQINARVSSNIYSANGTLAGARTLTLGGFDLDFIGTATTRFFANGRIGIGTTTDAGFRLDVAGSTRIVPPANTTGLTLSGYSLTGSDATSAIDISGTWNTTGTPTLIRANVTNTGSNASSNLIDLQVGGSSRFRVRQDGSAQFNLSAMTISSGGGVSAATFSTTFTTSNSITTFLSNPTFNPTSGSTTHISFNSSPTINQTGGANGITRGLYVNPTLTSAADWRSIEWSNNTGWGLYGDGSANNFLRGSLGIGNASLTGYSLRVQKAITGATIAFGIAQAGAVQSDVTTFGVGYYNALSTQASSFTLASYNHFYCEQSTIGLGSTISNQFGFRVDASLIGATNNFGFRGDIPSGTNRWNLFMNGTASNYLRGNLLLNTTTDAGFLLDVNGTARFSNDVTIADTRNIILSTTTGTRIGTATNQRLALWNATPNVQPTNAITAAAFVANTSGIVNDTATFGGYTIGQIVAALQRIGALA